MTSAVYTLSPDSNEFKFDSPRQGNPRLFSPPAFMRAMGTWHNAFLKTVPNRRFQNRDIMVGCVLVNDRRVNGKTFLNSQSVILPTSSDAFVNEFVAFLLAQSAGQFFRVEAQKLPHFLRRFEFHSPVEWSQAEVDSLRGGKDRGESNAPLWLLTWHRRCRFGSRGECTQAAHRLD